MQVQRLRRVGLFALFVLAAARARGQVITEFPIPTAGSFPYGITAGPDGNLWVTESLAKKIGRVTPAGAITEFSAPGGAGYGITAGSDGKIWFTEDSTGIGRMTTAGVYTEAASSTTSWAVTAGPDGNLWSTEAPITNRIGRTTPEGVTTTWSIPTVGAGPYGIVAGSDGNLWFTEFSAAKVGRITPSGTITEFPLTAGAIYGITAGPDGNLWFAEGQANKIGRITPSGVITDFVIPTASSNPQEIVAGADGNLWFTEAVTNKIGRITTAGVITEFTVPTPNSYPQGIAAGPDGNLWFTEINGNQIGRITTARLTPQALVVDALPTGYGPPSNLNGVIEPGESVRLSPSWKNTLTDPQTFAGFEVAGFPPGNYIDFDANADYGTIGAGNTVGCEGAGGDCYGIIMTSPHFAGHQDETFVEVVSPDYSLGHSWTLHIGGSFPDVPASNPFYASIENVFHHGVTSGCGNGDYCPGDSVTRAQMAVFLLKAKLGQDHIPPAASGTVFADVHAGDFAAEWIENLAAYGITGGCGASNYCPDQPVTRAEMAVFLLKSKHGSAYAPPSCTGVFADVACSPIPAFAADWIEQLFQEGITAGCDASHFCPDVPNTRDQMAAFLVNTFGMKLYAP